MGLVALALVASPAPARAFCGFYVNTSGGDLTNRATTVVLMREGTRTVVSMANHYEGPLEDFALVVPVPVVLRRGDVKTLPREVIDRLDRLSAPRLVEYWEENPCVGQWAGDTRYFVDGASINSPAYGISRVFQRKKVRVEARFAVGEYDVEVLSARDSTALESWLRAHGYRIPEGAAVALRPHVELGMKFFVAKVAIDRVTRDASGRVILSPLRFHYESADFGLPMRLGLLNAAGDQELIVQILARTRYQAANRPNLAIPTNLEVTPETRGVLRRPLRSNDQSDAWRGGHRVRVVGGEVRSLPRPGRRRRDRGPPRRRRPLAGALHRGAHAPAGRSDPAVGPRRPRRRSLPADGAAGADGACDEAENLDLGDVGGMAAR